MLTLTGRRTVAGCNIYRDDVDPFTWYYIPASPKVARSDDGRPVFSLVVYRRDLAALSEEERRTRLGGGVLTFTVELSASDEQLAEIRSAIAADPRLKLRMGGNADERRIADAIKLTTVPAMDGTVTVAIGGETGGEEGAAKEFVVNLVGAGKASLAGSHRAAFVAKLTVEGATLVEQMLREDMATVWVGYDLGYQHRLDAVKMIVHADAKKTHDLLQEQWQDLVDNASFSTKKKGNTTTMRFSHDESQSARDILRVVATANQTSYVRIIPEGEISMEQILELEEHGHDMLASFMSSTFLAFNPEAAVTIDQQPELATELPKYGDREYGHHAIHYYNLKDWEQSMSASLNHVFEAKTVLSARMPLADNLSQVLGDADVDALITHVDLDGEFFQYLDVQVLCTADFEKEPVDLVKVHLDYDATGARGRVHEVKDLVFAGTPGSQRFATFKAAPDANRYRYDATVHYKGSDAIYRFAGETDETILVLDADTLGLLKVDVQMGLIDWERTRQALVRLRYGAGGGRHETQMTFESGKDRAEWIEVIGEDITQAYEWDVEFVDSSGQRIKGDSGRSTASTLLINQPFTNEMRVDVVPAGNFKLAGGLLTQVKVALRYVDEANDHVVETIATLAKQEDSFTWTVPIIDKQRRSYEYQVTAVYVDGVTREDGWRTTDKQILPVGDPFSFGVVINPLLLGTPPGRFTLGTIELEYGEPGASDHARQTLQISDFKTPLNWFFRLESQDKRTYRYTLTLFSTTPEGEVKEIELPTQEHDSEILVLKPPPRD